MILHSDAVLAKLREKVRQHARDHSHHLLCPRCRVRTKLYTLKDERRKCSVCNTKFSPAKKTDAVKLQQYADALLCFCLDFPAKQTSVLTGYRYRLIAALYEHFRALLAGQNLTPGKMRLLLTMEPRDRSVHDSAFCLRCRKRFDCKGHRLGDAPIFGVRLTKSGQVFMEPLRDDVAHFRFDQILSGEGAPGQEAFSAFAGFICRGRFHRFEDNRKGRDGAEQLWSWMSERLRKHKGIAHRNMGLYLKELEWKFNHRLLKPEVQALKVADLLPEDFLTQWKEKTKINVESGGATWARADKEADTNSTSK